MAYNKKTWESDEVITQEALNNMEDGIAAAHTAIAATNTNLAGKQDALTPGSGITITDNTIAIDAAHASGTETPAQQKPATVGKVEEMINNDGGHKYPLPYDIDEIRRVCPYYLQDDPSNDLNLNSYGQSNYLFTKLKKIGTPQSEEKRFIWMSDAHYQNINAVSGLDERQNSKTWRTLMKAVKSAYNIPWCIFCGDAFEAASAEDNNNNRGGFVGARMLGEFMSDWYSVAGSNTSVVCGNHDSNNAGFNNYKYGDATKTNISSVIKSSVIEDITMGMISGRQFDDEGIAIFDDYDTFGYDSDKLDEVKAYMRLNYYVDDYQNKVRHIVLNTNNKSIEETEFGISTYAGVEFSYFLLAKALQTLPRGYDVIIEMHEYPGSSATSTSSVPILDMIKAWRDNLSSFGIFKYNIAGDIKKWYFKHNVDIWNNQPDNYRSVVHVSFAGANVGKLLILLGHSHSDSAHRYYRTTNSSEAEVWGRENANSSSEFSEGDILALTIQKSCYGRTDGAIGMVKSTITETAFDLIKWIPGTSVELVRIGNGSDRFFNYPN